MSAQKVLNFVLEGIILVIILKIMAGLLSSFSIDVNAYNVIPFILCLGLIGLSVWLICSSALTVKGEDETNNRNGKIGFISHIAILLMMFIILIINGAYTESYVAMVFLIVAIVLETIGFFIPPFSAVRKVFGIAPAFIMVVITIVIMARPKDMGYLSLDYYLCLLLLSGCGVKIAHALCE